MLKRVVEWYRRRQRVKQRLKERRELEKQGIVVEYRLTEAGAKLQKELRGEQ